MRTFRPLTWAMAVAFLAASASWTDTTSSDVSARHEYDLLAHKLRVGERVDWWRGLSGSWEVESGPLSAATPSLTGRVRAEQELRLRWLRGSVQVAAAQDLRTSEWLEKRVEAELRFQASPVRGLGVKLEPHAWSETDLAHLRAAIRSSLALKLWGPVSLAAQLDSAYDRALGQWEHNPTVGLQVDSREFNWKLPKL